MTKEVISYTSPTNNNTIREDHLMSTNRLKITSYEAKVISLNFLLYPVVRTCKIIIIIMQPLLKVTFKRLCPNYSISAFF